ncbi:MAG TPA: SDR family NAD(P)-dependent oxidoreductase, partial [Opitutaceae bacterium]|nr:SDR family NAD(P)-dependent oxidoreductase [Opitutaceae bacterium]
MAASGTNLRALVTGGATNIGRAITECLVRDGASVVVGQPDPSVAADLAARHPDRVTAVAYDQGRPEDCRRLV